MKTDDRNTVILDKDYGPIVDLDTSVTILNVENCLPEKIDIRTD